MSPRKTTVFSGVSKGTSSLKFSDIFNVFEKKKHTKGNRDVHIIYGYDNCEEVLEVVFGLCGERLEG